MLRSSATRAIVRVLVASQLLSGVPALAAPQDRPRASEQAPPPETRKAEPPRAPNRTVPKVDPPPTVFSLSASPSDAELTRARIFAEPLVPMPHGTTPAENRALARAIDEYAQIGQSEMVAPLLAFLAQYPQSAWRPSLLANLGTVYRANGYLGKALNAWEHAWIASKAETDLRAKAVADFALGEWMDLSSKVGHADAIEGRFAEIGGRNVTGRAAQRLGMAREALSILRYHHEEAAASGPAALESIIGYTAYTKHQPYTPNPILAKYHAMPSGTSLSELKTLAKRIGLSYELAFRTGNSPFPIPSIIHWRIDHYSAVVKQDGGKYLLVDPILGGERWLTPEALNEEASGYVLASKAALSDGWRAVTPSEASAVIGHCAPGAPDDDDPGPGDGPPPDGPGPGRGPGEGPPPDGPGPGRGDDGPPPDGPGPGPGDDSGPPPDGNGPDPGDGDGGCGMPIYRFERMPASLRLRDVPLACHSPVGPATAFGLTYRQREGGQPQVFAYGNVGPKWTFDWLSWVTDDPNSADVQADVHLRRGGSEHFTGPSGGVYPAHWRSGATLVKVSGSPIRYERRLRNGGVEVFTQSDGVITAGRHVYMTDVIDPQGLTLHMTYDANLRLVAVTDAIGLVTTLSYELASDPTKITKVTDPYGRFATLTYNEAGELASITDVIGMTSSFGYGTGDFVSSVTTPYGTTLFTHEADAVHTTTFRFIQATDPLGGTERVEFRWSTTDIASTAPSNQVPTGFSAYNQNLDHFNSLYWNKRAMALYPGDVSKAVITHWLTYVYVSYIPIYYSHGFSTSAPHSVKRPLENRVWYSYPDEDTAGNSVGSWVGTTKVARVLDDGSSQIWQAAYNSKGHRTQATDPLGRQQTFTYATNAIDLLTVSQTTSGLTDLLATFSNYTAQHRPGAITDAAGQTTTATYNSFAQVLTVTNATSETTTYAYDSNGYLQSVTRPVSGATTSFTYDAYGRVRTATESDGYTTTIDYDALDRPTRVTYPDGTHNDIVYNRLDAEQIKDRLGRVTRRFFDSVRHLTATRDPLGRTIRNEWCICGSLDALVDGKGQRTSWERDAQGRVTREVRADGTTSTVYAYENTTSRLRTITDPKGQVATRTYALDGARTQVAYTNAEHATPTVSLTYDTNYARVTSMVDGTGTTTYAYKAVGTLGATQVASVDGPLTNDTITYDYDELGRPVGRAINGVGLTRAYDAVGRLSEEVNPLGTFDYTYVGVTGRLATTTYPNGQTTTYSYFGNTGGRRLQTIHHKKPDASTLSRFDYTYDVIGNIVTWMQQADSAAPTGQQFGYDSADQLTSVVKQTTDPTPTILKRYAYAYDSAGNRSSEQIDDSIVSVSHDSLNRLTSQSSGGPIRIAGTLDEPASVTIQGKPATVDAANRFQGTVPVTSGTTTVVIAATDGSGNRTANTYEIDQTGGGTSLSYDANGNLASDGTRSFTWDAENRLISVTVGTHTSTFSYDGLRRRVEIVEVDNGSTTSDTKFLWCGFVLCEAREANTNAIVKRYFDDGVQDGGVAFFYTRDHLGSVRELIDTSGVVRARYDFDPFGRRTQVSGNKDADFGFTGHYQHTSSGLLLAPARAYDPNLGQWISEDPAGMIDGPNLYGYVFGNPLKWYDPLGLCGADGDDQTKTKEKTARAAAEILSSAWDSIVDNVTEFVIDKATKSPLLSLFHSALGGADTLKNVQTITEPARQEQLNRIQQWNKLMDEIGTGPYVPPSSKK